MINLSINRNKPELLRGMYYKDVIVESKLLGSPIIVFNYIFQWISSETPPETIIINNSVCYYCTINKIADDTMLSVNSVRESIDKLINGTIQLIDKFYDSKSHKLYLKIYPENIRRILAEGITSNDKYFNYLNEYEEINVCENSFFEELKVVKKYSKESEDLVVSLLEKNSDIFKTRIPKNLDNPTKTFEKACKIMQDIYNGNFTNAKFYHFAPSFENDNRFAVDGWRDMISDVKGNWDKIIKLMDSCICNFRLMFEENRLPFKKDYLQNNLAKWLYDDSGYNDDCYTSQFVQCLFEPKTKLSEFSEKKADRIYDSLPKEAKIGGNKLYTLAPSNINNGKFWENISLMLEWGNRLLNYDDNAKYWFEDSSKLPELYYNYLLDNNISVNYNTFNVEYCIRNNAPFRWFLSENCRKYSIDIHIINCYNDDDFHKLEYRKRLR